MFDLLSKITESEATNLNPVVLAFIGDAVYSLFVRENLATSTDLKTGELNKKATSIVNAKTQAETVNKILPILTEQESNIFKRGRNAKKPTKSKSASIREYNLSTGFEALIGYLYITGNYQRLNIILNEGIKDESSR